MPSSIRRIIAEVGLRYRPTERADLEAHTARLALLASDLADMPADYLQRAVNMWVAKSPYLPKASDLVEVARGFVEQKRAANSGAGANVIAEMNARRSDPDLLWVRDAGGSLKLLGQDDIADRNRRNDMGQA